MSHLVSSCAVLFVFCAAIPAFADDEPRQLPLSVQIDAIVAHSQFGPVAARCDDATFLRRVFLDLLGRIPTIEETRTFFSDERPNRRTQLVDRLIAHPDFAKHLAVTFDVMLMERRGGTHVPSDEFRSYLEDSFRKGKSYLQIVEEILSADGSPDKNRAAAAFYLERELTPDLMTREVGRVFFGVDLQCAQCHNHPNVDDYHQEDYYGLKAFVVRASIHQPDKKQPALIAEKADGEADFKSVFTDRAGVAGPRFPGGVELVEAILRPDQQYQVAPAKNVRHLPQFSRLQSLASAIVEHPSPQFDRNIANRLWAHFFGRGLVHPVDLHHSNNPASNPELLEQLASSFSMGGYHIAPFIREIVLSETYQRSAQLPPAFETPNDLSARIAEQEAEAERQLDQSYEVDQQVDAAVEALDAAVAELAPFQAEIDKANKAVAEALKVRDEALAKLQARQQEIASQQSATKLVAEAFEKTQAAANSLKDDKELAAAAETLRKKAETLNAEISKLQEAEKAAAAALATAEEKLKTTHAPADAAIAAIQPQRTKVRELRQQLFDKRALAARHRRSSSIALRQADHLKSQAELLAVRSRIQQLQGEIPQQEQQFATAKQTANTLQQTVQQLTQQMVKLQDDIAEIEGIVAELQSEMQKQTQLKDSLKTSLATLTASLEQLNADAQFAEAHSSISSVIQLTDANLTSATGKTQRRLSELAQLTAAHSAAVSQLESQQQQLMQQRQQIESLEKTLAASRQELLKSQETATVLWATVIDKSVVRLNAANMAALSPEQLGWSVLIATGQNIRQRQAEAAKLNKEKPLSEDDLKDAAKVAAREQEIDQVTDVSLRKSVDRFVQLFGSAAGQPQGDFFATADQALFFANGGEVRSWLSPSSGNLTDRLNQIEDTEQLAAELYLSVLCRMPDESETRDVANYLAQRAEAKSAAVQELAWALLTSAEFRFKY